MLVAKQQCTRQEETATGYIKAPNKQPKKSPRRLISLVGINLVILICINLIIHGLLLQQNYQSKALGDQIEELDRQLLETQMEISKLGSFERIQEVAVTKLGMKLPEKYDEHSLMKQHFEVVKPEAAHNRKFSKTFTYENNLWAQAAAWLSSLGATMAQEH